MAKYIIVHQGIGEGEAGSHDITYVDLTGNQLAQYMEDCFTRDVPPPAILPLSVLTSVLKRKPLKAKDVLA
jgi:hypothetical protein